MTTWQPIESAPLHEVLLVARAEGTVEIAIRHENGWTTDDDMRERPRGFTHWMPCPKAPAKEEQQLYWDIKWQQWLPAPREETE